MTLSAVALLVTTTLSSGLLAQIQPANFEMIDSNGQVLGPLVEAGSSYSVVGLDASGHSILALVGHDDFGGAMFLGGPSVSTGSVYYASSDCTGPAYIGWVPGATTMEPQAIVGPAATLFIGSSRTPQGLSALSALRPGASCTSTSETLTSAIPATAITNLIPHFTPPFRIRSVFGPFGASVPALGYPALAILALGLALLGMFFISRRTAA
jgi:hypothetical protein